MRMKDWSSATMMQSSAIGKLDDSLCRVYVPWWNSHLDVPAVAVRSAPIHFLQFIDAFFHDIRLSMPFHDPDALAACFNSKAGVNFESFWPLVELWALRVQLNTAGLATRIMDARLDHESFARIGKRYVFTLSCARRTGK